MLFQPPYDETKDNNDMWGNNKDSSMWGIPPDGDDYWEARRHPHFKEEVYWLDREAKFWKEAAVSFYWMCGGRNDCGDLDAIGHLCQHYAQWIEENECVECGTNEDLFACEGTDFDGYEGTYYMCRVCKHELLEEGMN